MVSTRTPARQAGQSASAPAARHCAALRVQRFGVDAPLHGKALHRRRRGRVQAQVVQALACRQLDLRLHQVHACDLFGDGVLDLQARIGFDEDVGQDSEARSTRNSKVPNPS